MTALAQPQIQDLDLLLSPAICCGLDLGGPRSVDHDSHGGVRHGRAAGTCHLDGIAAGGCAGVGCTGVGRRSGRVGGAAASDGRSSELRDEQQAKQGLPSPPVDWQPEEEHCRHAHTAAHGEDLLQRVVERSGGCSRGVDGQRCCHCGRSGDHRRCRRQARRYVHRPRRAVRHCTAECHGTRNPPAGVTVMVEMPFAPGDAMLAAVLLSVKLGAAVGDCVVTV